MVLLAGAVGRGHTYIGITNAYKGLCVHSILTIQVVEMKRRDGKGRR